MTTVHQIKKKINITYLIETIASAYQEISQREMNKIREMTLKNRQFMEKMIETYSELKKASLLEEPEEKEKKPTMAAKKERAVIFLSTNARFYGSFMLEIFKKVFYFLKKSKGDLVVVGEVGKNLVEKTNPDLKFHYFSMDDEKPTEEEVKKLIEFLRNYQELIFFHGKFKTILTQEVSQTVISEKIPEKEIKTQSAYLFEPSKEAILDFFEKEMMKNFFLQIFLEHRLSRHATRMVQMYRIKERAKERREELEKLKRRFKWQNFDKRQMEITLSSKLWQPENKK